MRFGLAPHGFLHNVLFVQAIGALAIITLSILFLSGYAVRWITSPLSSIASAARAFGRSEDDEPDLSLVGPREIREAAAALNDMRKRVRALVRERTLMLTAISHDLRTPLTRLRLRTERVTEEPVRAAMMQDILLISDMVGETLAYVRASDRPEPAALTDLPSLLETIAAQFLDVGHAVSYRGPDRLTFAGRAQGIGRAVTNVVENGTKYGTTSRSGCAHSKTAPSKSRSATMARALRRRFSTRSSSLSSRATRRDRRTDASASDSASRLRVTSPKSMAARSACQTGRRTASACR